MFPLLVIELEQRKRPFQEPKKSDATYQQRTSVRRRDGFEVVDNGFQWVKICSKIRNL